MRSGSIIVWMLWAAAAPCEAQEGVSSDGLVYQDATEYTIASAADIQDLGDLGISGNGARTVALWMKAEAGRQVPFSMGNPNWDTTCAAFDVLASSASTCAGVSGYYCDHYPPVSGCTQPTDGTWHHIAAVYDGSVLKMFLDGVYETQKTVQYVTTAGSAFYGGAPHYAGFPFAGLLKGLYVFAVALSAGDVAKLHQGIGVASTPTSTTSTNTSTSTTTPVSENSAPGPANSTKSNNTNRTEPKPSSTTTVVTRGSAAAMVSGGKSIMPNPLVMLVVLALASMRTKPHDLSRNDPPSSPVATISMMDSTLIVGSAESITKSDDSNRNEPPSIALATSSMMTVQ